MTDINPHLLTMGRLLLAVIFVMAGVNKIFGYAGTQQYMESYGVPGFLLPLVIALELGGGLAVAAGFMTRWAAQALAVFTLLSAFIFHFDFGDQAQSIQFMKNLAIAGGLLALSVSGQGAWALGKN
jgi:putative oxidoreductase